MTSQHDKAKRWQFGLRTIIGWTTLVAISLSLPPPVAWVVCLFAFGSAYAMFSVGEGRSAGLAVIVFIASLIRLLVRQE